MTKLLCPTRYRMTTGNLASDEQTIHNFEKKASVDVILKTREESMETFVREQPPGCGSFGGHFNWVRYTHPYLSEPGGYPGWGWGVIGPDMVDLDFAYLPLIFTFHFIFKEHNKMLALYPNLHLYSNRFIVLLYVLALLMTCIRNLWMP